MVAESQTSSWKRRCPRRVPCLFSAFSKSLFEPNGLAVSCGYWRSCPAAAEDNLLMGKVLERDIGLLFQEDWKQQQRVGSRPHQGGCIIRSSLQYREQCRSAQLTQMGLDQPVFQEFQLGIE